MNAGEQICPILDPFVNQRCYPLQRLDGEDTATPYIVYTPIDSIPDTTMDGFSGHEYTRVQIDIYHHHYDQLDVLANQVIAVIQNQIPRAEFLNRQHLIDNDSQLYRQSMDWQLWTST